LGRPRRSAPGRGNGSYRRVAPVGARSSEGPLSERISGHSDLVVRAALDASTRSLVPLSAFSSSLSYYDGCVAARGPANLLQGLRDYFGAHTYRRLDAEGSFHTRWGQDGKEVPIR
jgi:6-phosphogluconate dehydrogenase